MSTISYRTLQAADLEQISVVAFTAWQWTYRDIFDAAFIEQFVHTNYARDKQQQTFRSVERGQSFFEVVLDEAAIIGFCQIDQMLHGARLSRLSLVPAYIGRGIGTRLLTDGETWLQVNGTREYGCFVHAANEVGKRFYERHGFTHQTEHDQEDEWYMHKQLFQ